MASLRDIRKRVRSLKASQKITRAMQMVAASKLRRAQEALARAEPFATCAAATAARLAAWERQQPAPQALFAEQAPGPPVWLVLGSERGLCGPFNAQLVRWLDRRWQAGAGAGPARHEVVAIGRKVLIPLRRRGDTVVAASPPPLTAWQATVNLCRELLPTLLGPQPRPLLVVYNHFHSIMRQQPACRQAWPLPAAGATTAATPLLVEPSSSEVALPVVLQAVAASVWLAQLASTASEQGARMTAMDAATTNARELMDALTLQYNRARQAAITRDLMDIVGGAEALASG